MVSFGGVSLSSNQPWPVSSSFSGSCFYHLHYSAPSSSSFGFYSIILASDVRDKISFSIKTKQNKAMSVLSCFVMQVALCYVSEHAAHRICPGVSAFRVLERKSCRIRKWLLYCTNLRRGKAYVLRKSALQGFTRRV